MAASDIGQPGTPAAIGCLSNDSSCTQLSTDCSVHS
jgi:hypothetical protein